MTITLADLQEWNPEAIDELSRAAAARARTSREKAQELPELTVLQTWEGQSGEAAREALRTLSTRLEISAQTAVGVALGAQKVHGEAVQIKSQLAALFDDANAAPAVFIDTATNTVVPPDTTGWDPVEIACLQAKVDELQSRIALILGEGEAADAELAGLLTRAVGLEGSSDLPRKAPYDTGSDIPVGRDPKEVEQWWESLPQDKKDQLLRDWPDRIGALDGVPVVDRHRANTTVMQRDIDRLDEVAAARGVTPEEVLAHPERYGMAGPVMDRYRNALKAKEALAETSTWTRAQTFLQVYQPEAFGGDGRAAIAIGDPDHAVNTAVVVPGTGNSVRSGWLAQKDAINLYNEVHNVDLTKPVSVVAWMGYDAPDSPIDPRIGTTALAHEGGQLLAADVNALNATHDGAGHITVLGHSYGSTTVADAAAGFGMHADDVVLVGSPGTDMARSASDFHLNPGGHLYVGAASSDPVTQLGALPQTAVPGTGWSVALGTDPALDGYGSTRFKAEVPGLTFPLSDHSEYYTPRGESLYSMADIASGYGESLAQHGMTAPHRIPALQGIPVLSDPETYRPGTSGHLHGPD